MHEERAWQDTGEVVEKVGAYVFRIALAFTLLTGVLPQTAFAQSESENQGLWSKDKQAHMAMSAAAASLFYITARNRKMDRWRAFATSFTLTMTIGFVKEMTDSTFNTSDLGADAIGALGGAGLFLTIDAAFL